MRNSVAIRPPTWLRVAPVDRLADGFEPVGEGQELAHRLHPFRQGLERDVHAAEQEEEEDEQVGPEEPVPQAERHPALHRANGRARERGHDHGQHHHAQGGGVEPDAEEDPAQGEAVGGDQEPVHDERDEPPPEQGGPVRGAGHQGGQGAEPPLVGDGHGHAVDARHGAHLDRVADGEVLRIHPGRVAAQGGEEQDLEGGRAEHGGDVDRGAGPVEQRGVAQPAAIPEDPPVRAQGPWLGGNGRDRDGDRHGQARLRVASRRALSMT